jgi:hypothetical protein
MKNKIIVSSILLTTSSLLIYSCKQSFLEPKPQGVYSESQLSNKQGVNGILINTYGTLDGVEGQQDGGASNWTWGSIAGGDAYKGTERDDRADQNPIMRYDISGANPILGTKWNSTWDGVGQANSVLKIMAIATDMTDAEKKQVEGEARFIRGHHHFEAKKMWNNVPFLDEKVVDFKVPNTDAAGAYVNIWPQIEADFKFAYDNLDEVKTHKGRANKWAAASYLAKVYMFQKKFAEAKALLTTIIASGKNSAGVKYALTPSYSDNFRVTKENNEETVFAIQSSYGDGSNNNGNYDNSLNYPHGGGSKPGGCCGFFSPSQSLVNSYQTDASGLPLIDNFNATDVKSDETVASTQAFTTHTGTLDPRLDWSVGRRGVPYYDWGMHPGRDWIRKVEYGGPYSPKKNTYYLADKGTSAGTVGWGFASNALNYSIIRYADVLLWAAEAEIETGGLEVARGYINLVRERGAKFAPAATATGGNFYVAANDPSVTYAKYNASTYTMPFANADAARKAVRFERKLELAMEGHRFFDLVRWGIADVELNAYLAKDGAKRTESLGGGATFKKGKTEYYPIPDNAITQSIKDGKPTLKQNPNY